MDTSLPSSVADVVEESEILVDDEEASGRNTSPVEAIVDLRIECKDDAEYCMRNDSNCGMRVESSSNESENTTACVSGTVDLKLRVAWSLKNHGRVEECMEILEKVVVRNPKNADALYLQGACLYDLGRKANALASVAGALAIEPDHHDALILCSRLMKDVGKLDKSLEMIEKAFLLASERKAEDDGESTRALCSTTSIYAAFLTDIATADKLQNRDGWLEKYQKIVDICPSHAPAHYNLGVAAGEDGRDEDALQHYKRAIEIHPNYVEALCNTGVILEKKGQFSEALRAYEKAYQIAPTVDIVAKNYAVSLTHYAARLKNENKVEESIKLYEQAISVLPTCMEALYNLGVVLTEIGDHSRAIFMYHCAIKENPNCAEAHNNLGVLYRMAGNMELAIKSHESALQANPNFPQGLNNLAVMYTQQGKALLALNMLRAALMTEPMYAEAWNNLGVLQRDVGEADEAVQSYDKCCEIEPGSRNASQNLLLALNYLHDGSERAVCKAHADWGRQFQEKFERLPEVDESRKSKNGQRIRLGYVSPDFFIHSVSFFAEVPITKFDSDAFDVYIYSACASPDAKTRRLKMSVEARGGTWRDISKLTEENLAKLVREDEVDILIDLTGHTANNRLGTFAMKPAPVQVTWIGYPNSTGLQSIDYRLTDPLCDPLDTEQTFVEELVHLPRCFLCYTPCPEVPDVAPLPSKKNGYITFGSFNALAKQTPEVLHAWAKILLRIPDSRLVLKNKPFACESVRQKFWSVFAEHGVPKERIDLLPLAATTDLHLEQYSLVDICLDPWPYTGTTTTAEALYMGVPCLTMAGKGHAHNVGVSLLTTVGLKDQWIARSVSDYIEKAVKISSDIDSLSELRDTLRECVSHSALCDSQQFMQDLENCFSLMWQRFCAS